MKQMNDNIFLDTNILVYSYSNNEPDKLSIARTLISENNSFVSTQVLQELSNTITRKLGFSYADAINVIKEVVQNNNLHTNTQSTITEACQIAEHYKFSFYDSMILAAALEANCSILYSEDMHHNQVIDGKIKIINPFYIS
jgi:predicted nucleic acid-binding protein